jgi:hypothetical protein
VLRILRQLDFSTRNEKVFKTILDTLPEMVIHWSVRQFRKNIKNHEQEYKKIKDHHKSGSDRKAQWWFDTIYAVIECRPGMSSQGTLDSTSPTVILEAILTLSRDDQHGNTLSSA